MAESKEIPSQYDLDAKWDAYLDLGVRRFVYSSATGVLAGLLLFLVSCAHCCMQPLLLVLCSVLLNNLSNMVSIHSRLLSLSSRFTSYAHWASVAFGAGVGIGSAYSECSHKFNEA
ncbi:hypothetical protein L2E82_49008 [Cichorium intybus]|uniref:Uncharacterized protein n=1 Tax=Cichorium intybus TaxID=13427 RepID=A0ACB8YZ96_CICIN|nr:hypothetical protein L2E82_49008 [Cichorium intybus]